MSTQSTLAQELAVVMSDHTAGPGVELVYVPLYGEREEPPWDELDDGIRETVRWLYDNGFNPTSSSEPWVESPPYVQMVVRLPDHLETEVDRLDYLLREKGIRLRGGPFSEMEAKEMGVKWVPPEPGMTPGLLEGAYAPGGPALILLTGVYDELLGFLPAT